MPGRYLVGIDNGGTFVKAVVFDLDGRELGIGSGSIPLLAGPPAWSDVDIDALWTQTAAAIRAALGAAGVDVFDIAGVGLSGTGNGLCVLDAARRPLRPMALSSDARAAEIVAEWNASGLGDELFPTIRQGLWSGQPAALLAWLRREEPSTFAAIRSVLLCKDWIRLKLTGELWADVTDMTAAGLTDVARETYAPDVLRALGLAEMIDCLPPLAGRGTAAGVVTPEAASATGLAPGTPVAAGLFDCAATALGSGCTAPGQVSLIVGTWSINQVVVDEPRLAPGIAFTTSHAVPGQWLLLEASATSATNLAWYVDELAAADRAEAERRGVPVYTVLDETLGTIPPGAEGVTFHPYLRGSLTNPAARAAFLGIGAWHHRAHLLRAVYEGVAFSHLEHVDRLRAVVSIDEARLTGGGSRSPVWCQIFADILGLPVVVPSSTEAGARGAALDAGVAVGAYPDHLAAVLRTEHGGPGAPRRYEPDPDNRASYRAAHEVFHTTAAALGALAR